MLTTSSSTSSTTTVAAISSFAGSTLASIPIHHAVTIRLNRTNFVLWCTQLLPYMGSTKLMGYLDGSMRAPAKKIAAPAAEGADLVPNPAYDQWYDQNQTVLSGLLSSMTEDVLEDVVTAMTSKEAWDILQHMFSSATRSCSIQIRVDLTTTKKRDLFASDYFTRSRVLPLSCLLLELLFVMMKS